MGIVHRDLKPANLFVTRRPDGNSLVKVLDFGISKTNSLHESASAVTHTKAIMGSPLYMSPEQMRSTRDVDGKADVWSLGVILYQLLSGRVPFEADTLGDLMARVLEERPRPLVELDPKIPPSLSDLVQKCLERDRSRRCKSVAELARGLAPFAPMRTRALAERITTVLKSLPPPEDLFSSASGVYSAVGTDPRRGVGAQSALSAGLQPNVMGTLGVATSSRTDSSLNAAIAPPVSRTAVVAAGVAALVAIAVVVALVVFGLNARTARLNAARNAAAASASATVATDLVVDPVAVPALTASAVPESTASDIGADAAATTATAAHPTTTHTTATTAGTRPSRPPRGATTGMKTGDKPPAKNLLDDRN